MGWGDRGKVSFKGITSLILLISCFNGWAATEVSFASGGGVAKSVPLRVGIQKSFEKRWTPKSTWPIAGYWEASLYHLTARKGVVPGTSRHLKGAALAGVFRFERGEAVRIGYPYLELGIGLSWISRQEFAARDLGMHLQFEDRFGLGVRFGSNREYDIGYKAIHFSNAYIGPVNHGINLHVLQIGYWFN